MENVMVNLNLEIAVKMGRFDRDHSGCVGYFPDGTTYKDLVKVFGEPQVTNARDGKTQVEWIGKINGMAFTVYDYKSDGSFKDNRDWHIGGYEKICADLVKVYFEYKI